MGLGPIRESATRRGRVPLPAASYVSSEKKTMSKRILAIVTWAVWSCPIALALAQPGSGTKPGATGEVPRAARGLRQEARRHRPRQAGDGRVRLDDGRREAQGAGLHAAGLLQGQEVSGPVPAPRHRRRRERVDARRRARRDPGQPVRRQEGGADDRRHAQRPGVEGRDGTGPDSPSSRRRSPRSRRTCSTT